MTRAGALASDEGKGRTALITGASAGIGVELAKVFAAHGFNLVLTARRAERLVALADLLRATYRINVHPMPADLARPETCANLLNALAKDGVSIDALVNNAGFGVAGMYRDTSWEAQRDLIQVLVTAPCEMTHRLLPGMTARGYGRILNIASVAGFIPGSATGTLYGGTKAMLIKWSEGLHSEQKGTGVHVTVLCPGFTATEFHAASGMPDAIKRVPKSLWLSASRVATEGYDALMRNRWLCIPGAQYKAITAFARLLPLNTAHRMAETGSKRLIKRT